MYLIRSGRRVQFSGLTTKIKRTVSPTEQRWAYGDSIRRESLTDPSCGFLAPDGSVTIEVREGGTGAGGAKQQQTDYLGPP